MTITTNLSKTEEMKLAIFMRADFRSHQCGLIKSVFLLILNPAILQGQNYPIVVSGHTTICGGENVTYTVYGDESYPCALPKTYKWMIYPQYREILNRDCYDKEKLVKQRHLTNMLGNDPANEVDEVIAREINGSGNPVRINAVDATEYGGYYYTYGQLYVNSLAVTDGLHSMNPEQKDYIVFNVSTI